MNPDGTALKILDLPGGKRVISPDGSKVAFLDGNDVYVSDIDGSGVTNVTNLTNSAKHDQGYLYVHDRIGGFYIDRFNTHLAWSPDGQKIAFSREGSCSS
jgi:Tol biopolymer transport system component